MKYDTAGNLIPEINLNPNCGCGLTGGCEKCNPSHKTYWNHRVIKMPDEKIKNLEQTYSFGIYEVYYDENHNPHSWTENPIYPVGETYEELVSDFKIMSEDFNNILSTGFSETFIELPLSRFSDSSFIGVISDKEALEIKEKINLFEKSFNDDINRRYKILFGE